MTDSSSRPGRKLARSSSDVWQPRLGGSSAPFTAVIRCAPRKPATACVLGCSRVAAWGILRSGAVVVLPITDTDLADLQRLMEKYADRPMDFADATLVHLARRESLTTICTVDHNDFETYRIDGKRKFRIVPSR